MQYQLVYTKRAVKDIDKLDVITKRRLKRALEKFATSPLEHSTRLIDSKIGQYRYRIGDYRIIFDMMGKDIVILRVGHRREIYR